jgi:hypothetical protein
MTAQYCSRAATWHRMGDQVVVHDSFTPQAPRMITMDPWPQLVFSAADGQHTVQELITQLTSDYECPPPDGLASQVEEVIRQLVGEGILKLHEAPVVLPPYFAEDYFAATPETRAQQMRAHGLIA